MTDIVQKLWGFCHTLRHDGVDYGDYIEQITYLLFLKMADERGVPIPKSCDWPTLSAKSGIELVEHYTDSLRKLGQQSGILGDIYAKSQNRFNRPGPSHPQRQCPAHRPLLGHRPRHPPAPAARGLGYGRHSPARARPAQRDT